MVTALTSISAIMNATAILIIEVDVPNRILVGNILRAPKDKRIKIVDHVASQGEKADTAKGSRPRLEALNALSGLCTR